MAYGNVYVFNLYSQSITELNVNEQGSAGKIAAPSAAAAAPYTPPQLVVARTNLTQGQLNTPLFVTGSNNVLINYGGQSGKLTVTLPGPPESPLEDDLWLYLAYKQAFLFLPTGQLVPQGKDKSAAITGQ